MPGSVGSVQNDSLFSTSVHVEGQAFEPMWQPSHPHSPEHNYPLGFQLKPQRGGTLKNDTPSSSATSETSPRDPVWERQSQTAQLRPFTAPFSVHPSSRCSSCEVALETLALAAPTASAWTQPAQVTHVAHFLPETPLLSMLTHASVSSRAPNVAPLKNSVQD